MCHFHYFWPQNFPVLLCQVAGSFNQQKIHLLCEVKQVKVSNCSTTNRTTSLTYFASRKSGQCSLKMAGRLVRDKLCMNLLLPRNVSFHNDSIAKSASLLIISTFAQHAPLDTESETKMSCFRHEITEIGNILPNSYKYQICRNASGCG